MDQMLKIRDLLGKGEIYALPEEVCLMRAEECAQDDFAAVKGALLAAGGSIWDEWSEYGSSFAVCKAFGRSWNLSWHERTKALRVVSDKEENLAPRTAQEGPVSPLITQGRLLYYAYDCGMLYTIRLSDGRFVVIDGGMGEYEEPEHFLDLLNAQNTRPGVPEIAAWFITHAHNDHFMLLLKVCDRFYDRLKIDALVYNWAAPERIFRGSDLTEFNRVVAEHPDIKRIRPHTGQRFVYPGAEFKVLYTHEDRCPDFLNNFNDTSTVMRMESCGRRVMWTGDAMRETADLLCAEYPKEALKSEFLQVCHHGYSGGSDEFYRAVDAETLIWPCPDFWYYTQSALECNRYLSESPNIKAMFMSGREETTIDLTKPVVPSDPYANYAAPKPGDVLLDEDFSGGNLYDVAWTAVTGGRTNYKSADLALVEGGCRMTASEDRFSVCEVMQPGMLKDAPSFRVRLQGRAETIGTAALFWNHSAPWEYSDDEALDLGLVPGTAFDVELTVDGESGTAVYTNGELVREIRFTPASRKGLYLILKDSEIVLGRITVVR